MFISNTELERLDVYVREGKLPPIEEFAHIYSRGIKDSYNLYSKLRYLAGMLCFNRVLYTDEIFYEDIIDSIILSVAFHIFTTFNKVNSLSFTDYVREYRNISPATDENGNDPIMIEADRLRKLHAKMTDYNVFVKNDRTSKRSAEYFTNQNKEYGKFKRNDYISPHILFEFELIDNTYGTKGELSPKSDDEKKLQSIFRRVANNKHVSFSEYDLLCRNFLNKIHDNRDSEYYYLNLYRFEKRMSYELIKQTANHLLNKLPPELRNEDCQDCFNCFLQTIGLLPYRLLREWFVDTLFEEKNPYINVQTIESILSVAMYLNCVPPYLLALIDKLYIAVTYKECKDIIDNLGRRIIESSFSYYVADKKEADKVIYLGKRNKPKSI